MLMRRDVVLIALAATLLFAPAGYAEPSSHAVSCAKEAGFIAGPFVPDERTAKAIFVAVERSIQPRVDKKVEGIVAAED